MEETAKRYLEAYKQMTTVNTAGALIVLGIQNAISSDSPPNTLALIILVSSLVLFVLSLLFALYGMVRVTALTLGAEGGSAGFSFVWLTVGLGISIAMFFLGLIFSLSLFAIQITAPATTSGQAQAFVQVHRISEPGYVYSF